MCLHICEQNVSQPTQWINEIPDKVSLCNLSESELPGARHNSKSTKSPFKFSEENDPSANGDAGDGSAGLSGRQRTHQSRGWFVSGPSLVPLRLAPPARWRVVGGGDALGDWQRRDRTDGGRW